MLKITYLFVVCADCAKFDAPLPAPDSLGVLERKQLVQQSDNGPGIGASSNLYLSTNNLHRRHRLSKSTHHQTQN